jgi:hypothetical protein
VEQVEQDYQQLLAEHQQPTEVEVAEVSKLIILAALHLVVLAVQVVVVKED